jgi:hypothetical protein
MKFMIQPMHLKIILNNSLVCFPYIKHGVDVNILKFLVILTQMSLVFQETRLFRRN